MTRHGRGNDLLDLQYLRGDQVTLGGGAGYDSLSKSIPGPINQLIQTNWEVINGKLQIFQLPGGGIFLP